MLLLQFLLLGDELGRFLERKVTKIALLSVKVVLLPFPAHLLSGTF